MMRQQDFRRRGQQGNPAEQVISNPGVGSHDFPFLRGQLSPFEKDGVRNRNFPEVVQVSAAIDLDQFVTRTTHRRGYFRGKTRYPARMPGRLVVAEIERYAQHLQQLVVEDFHIGQIAKGFVDGSQFRPPWFGGEAIKSDWQISASRRCCQVNNHRMPEHPARMRPLPPTNPTASVSSFPQTHVGVDGNLRPIIQNRESKMGRFLANPGPGPYNRCIGWSGPA